MQGEVHSPEHMGCRIGTQRPDTEVRAPGMLSTHNALNDNGPITEGSRGLSERHPRSLAPTTPSTPNGVRERVANQVSHGHAGSRQAVHCAARCPGLLPGVRVWPLGFWEPSGPPRTWR